jgi:hypothetical protein
VDYVDSRFTHLSTSIWITALQLRNAQQLSSLKVCRFKLYSSSEELDRQLKVALRQ